MDLNELQSVRDRERQTDKLQQLRESFYADAGEFIQQLQAERDRVVERADDPFDSTEVRQLSDEIKTAEQTVEAIYEKRVGKIVKAASFAAADLPTEVEGMTAEEQALFDDLVGDIKANRRRVLDLLDGEDSGRPQTGSTASPSKTASDVSHDGQTPEHAGQDSPSQERTAVDPERSVTAPEEPPSQSSENVTAADVMGGTEEPTNSSSTDQPQSPQGSDSSPPGAGTAGNEEDQTAEDDAAPPSSEPVDPTVRNDGGRETVASESTGQSETQQDSPATERPDSGDSTGPEVERQRVQILDDVETFLGCDERDYDLQPDDIVSLPATNADILLERGVAREL